MIIISSFSLNYCGEIVMTFDGYDPPWMVATRELGVAPSLKSRPQQQQVEILPIANRLSPPQRADWSVLIAMIPRFSCDANDSRQASFTTNMSLLSSINEQKSTGRRAMAIRVTQPIASQHGGSTQRFACGDIYCQRKCRPSGRKDELRRQWCQGISG